MRIKFMPLTYVYIFGGERIIGCNDINFFLKSPIVMNEYDATIEVM